MHIGTVLCPVDFSAVDRGELAIAVEVCRTFGARLVVHHNVSAPALGFARVWDWEREHEGREHRRPAAEARLRAVLADLAGVVPAEAVVTVGPLGQVVLGLARELRADLVVLGSHGWSTPEHVSVAERLIASSPCPVLTFDARAGTPDFRLRDAGPLRVVVPTDLTLASAAAVAYACDLARVLPLQIDLLHVIDALHARRQSTAAAESALDALVPPDLVDRVESHTLLGTAAPAIIDHVYATTPAFAILGEHAHGSLRGLLTRDTTSEVMRGVRCPVWVVPPATAAAAEKADARG